MRTLATYLVFVTYVTHQQDRFVVVSQRTTGEQENINNQKIFQRGWTKSKASTS